ncbi:glycosyltransferase family 2 protein [Pseudomonas sp. DCB_CB]|uniref:glycosyltransferase n=1 Tax=Pseudomonas TaxID=286 RepID=UPI0002820426|nr:MULTISPECIES: glycosyltransferase [Pseudomonas]EMR46652.1 glycosyl transferase family protein [Pseudomonas putida LS46]MCX2692100.1 glycosyltransferase family 2 protein [Pseudomonas sp. DCB_BZ]MCX2857420.1 glycosyltransferase family 2 protein [Pseudomonas sp. DCB_CB]MDH1694273.1 glycosyltransferase family 2 protein [Pseudomonas sp. GD03766]UWH21590.1 glycosyltransferase family 2 protein [Pseudomonas sp. HD6515]
MIAVSIISHAHGKMVETLVASLLRCPEVTQLLITLNIPEALSLPVDSRVVVINNTRPLGFGANHNAAFQQCDQPYFCPLNPDIILLENPFPLLLEQLQLNGASLIAPLVISPKGQVEDSARYFPRLRELLLRPLGVKSHRYSLKLGEGTVLPDWVAGMFMLFKSGDYASIRGFDESYFLYYEDVDICVRLWKADHKVALCSDAQVIHDAQRASHRNLRFLKWHLTSMLRYYMSHAGRLPR